MDNRRFTTDPTPAAPTALNAVAASYARIDLTWTDNADNEFGFEIERSTTGASGTFSLLTTVPADTESYANTGLTGNSEYCYRVRAVNSAGNSTYSNVDCETTPPNRHSSAFVKVLTAASPLDSLSVTMPTGTMAARDRLSQAEMALPAR